MFVCPECGQQQAQAGHCPADGTQLFARGDDFLIGTTVGAYRVARLLGVGGMGRVYKGVHPTIGSRVAIKVLSRECADRPELVERFFSEARAVNLIRHESIVNVLDLAQLPDGRPFIIMEYLDGSPLADIIGKMGPMPLGGLARMIAEVLDALGAAHGKHIVHRDLKPDNIFVTPGGRAKVLDFGIAKLMPELGGSATQTGSLLGTPHYMAPEQALARAVDHRTDIYSMGVILFECVTGRRPFAAESLFDLLRQHVDVAPPMPRSLRPELPPAVEQVILRAMAKDPGQRFQAAAALANALMQATQGLTQEHWVPITPGTASQFAAQRTPISGGWGASTPGGHAPSTPGTSPGLRRPDGGHAPTPHPHVHSQAPTPPPPGPHAQAPYGHAPSYGQAPYGQPPYGQQLHGQQPYGQQPQPQPGPGGPGVQQGHPSTVSSGQLVSGRPPAGSKKGLWLALAGVVLVGGGIAAGALLATSGDDTTTATTGGTTATDDAGTAAAPVEATGDAAIAVAVRDVPPEAAEPKPKPAEDDDIAMPSDEAQAKLEQLAARLQQGGSMSDAELAALLEETATMMPPAEAAQLREAMAQVQALKTGGAFTPPTPGGGGGGGGAKSGGVQAFDVEANLAVAQAEARKLYSDAVLFRIDAAGVLPDGKANLTLADDLQVGYRFMSPSRAKRPDNVPLGIDYEWDCMVAIWFGTDGMSVSHMKGWECDDKPTPKPRCTAAQVWKKAIKKGAPAKNAVGELGYRATPFGDIVWYFNVGDAFSEMIKDDC